MPEGDTIYRAAVTMHRALAGSAVVAFESPLPRLGRVAEDRGLVGQLVDRVESRGKFLIVQFSGRLALVTHMRMHGSWHLYRSGERWRRPRRAMRLRLATAAWEAVGFDIPVAEFHEAAALERVSHLARLGPDPLAETFDPAEAVARLRAAGPVPIEEALLDQRCLTGVGNVLKSEILFLAGVQPYLPVERLTDAQLATLVARAQRLLRENVAAVRAGVRTIRSGARNTTGSANPRARLHVYGRTGRACRRCGTPIQSRRAGRHARSTYWCPGCQTA